MFRKLLTYFLHTIFMIFVLSATSLADYRVKGTFIYKDKIITPSGIFIEARYLPIRFALVEVYDAYKGNVLASTVTDSTGHFDFLVNDIEMRNVGVRCISSMEFSGITTVEITDLSGNLFALVPDTIYYNHNPSDDIDLSVIYANEDEIGGAFNIYDCGVNAVLYLNYLNNGFNKIAKLKWEQGSAEGTGYAVNEKTIYLLGLPTDSDAYDDGVIIHELGHFAAFNYARDNNPGVVHYITEKYPLHVSWSEGWANYFSCEVRRYLNHEYCNWYFDSYRQTPGSSYQVLQFELEEPSYSTYAIGSDNELSVAALLWDITDNSDTPDESPNEDDDGLNNSGVELYVWEDFTNFNNSTDLATLELFWKIWNSDEYNFPFKEEVAAIFLDRSVDYFYDEYEPDNTPEDAVFVSNFSYPESHTYYAKSDSDWFKIAVEPDKKYEITTVDLNNGADTYLELYIKSGDVYVLSASNNNNPNSTAEEYSSILEYESSGYDTVYIKSCQYGSSPTGAFYGSYSILFKVTDINVIIEEQNILFPKKYSLMQNYPNPFNASTVIRYNIKNPGLLRINIFNVLGQKINTLINRYEIKTGEGRITWDGRNDNGSFVSSGIYLCTMEINDYKESRKIIFLK